MRDTSAQRFVTMMVSPKSVGDAADAAEANNRDCNSDGRRVPIIVLSLVEARPESTPVGLLLLFVLAAALTHTRRRVLEAADCLHRLPTDEVDGRFDRRDSNDADMLVQDQQRGAQRSPAREWCRESIDKGTTGSVPSTMKYGVSPSVQSSAGSTTKKQEKHLSLLSLGSSSRPSPQIVTGPPFLRKGKTEAGKVEKANPHARPLRGRTERRDGKSATRGSHGESFRRSIISYTREGAQILCLIGLVVRGLTMSQHGPCFPHEPR